MIHPNYDPRPSRQLHDQPLVSIKRRTIIVWTNPAGEQLQTMPLIPQALQEYLEVGRRAGWNVLYLVRCRPRSRR